jgi:predicted nucleotidyltransferase
MNIIFETKFGSHIYGTSTPKSDVDYKGIYLANYNDIILNKVKDSIVTTTRKDRSEGVRNSAEDIDREYKELRRFLNDAISGQTYALDMLYTPQEFYIKTSPIWESVIKERHRFLSKSMNAFLGYIRQQTGKYAMKGTRMAAVVSTVEFLRGVNPSLLLNEVWDQIPKNDYVRLIEHEMMTNKELHTEVMLSVLEKKFQKNVKVKFVLDTLEKFYEEFGGRSQQAMDNQGVDWKAICHAYRACYQLLDIANEGSIIFPLKQAEYVLKVKNGNLSWKDVVQDELPELMNRAMEAIDTANLPNEVDRTYWDEFIIKTYE